MALQNSSLPGSQANDDADGGVEIGERVRAIRRLRQRTLRDIATEAGLSESFLSQLERGRTNASVSSLQRIAGALGIEVSDLFVPEEALEPRVLRRDLRHPVAFGAGARKAFLTPKPFKSIEVIVAEFEPGGSTGDDPYTHGDSEELFFVVSGTVHLQLGTDVHELHTGDSIHYLSSTPHRVSNPSSERAEAIFVISPPSY